MSHVKIVAAIIIALSLLAASLLAVPAFAANNREAVYGYCTTIKGVTKIAFGTRINGEDDIIATDRIIDVIANKAPQMLVDPVVQQDVSDIVFFVYSNPLPYGEQALNRTIDSVYENCLRTTIIAD